MRWQGGRRSANIQDRRGRGGLIAGGGVGAVVLALIAALLGVDPGAVMPGGGAPTEEVAPADPGAYKGVDEEADFISVVLAETEDVWNDQFRRNGQEYREPELVLLDRKSTRLNSSH